MDGGQDGEAAAVLGCDDLLTLILLHLVSPTSLVVCGRWYRVASHPDFLRRFRQLLPPRLLGFYLQRPRFLLAGPGTLDRHSLRQALRQQPVPPRGRPPPRQVVAVSAAPSTRQGIVLLPLLSEPHVVWNFLSKDGDDVIVLDMQFHGTRVCLASGRPVWTRAAIELPQPLPVIRDVLPPVHGKIHMTTDSGYVLVLDLSAGSFSLLRFPDRVRSTNFRLSCGEDSGLTVIYAEGSLFALRVYIWHRETGNNGTEHWTLVDTILVHEAYNRQEDVLVLGVDENAECLLLGLEASGILVYMHVKNKVVEKVFDGMKFRDMRSLRVFPFMMVWPPRFPALRKM